MATRKKTAAKKPTTKISAADPMDLVEVNGEQVLLFKAKEALGPAALKALGNALRVEQQASGLKVVLVPHSVESVEVGVEK